MKRLLPDIYWDPSGKHGIIDTGKTIEFWIKDIGQPDINYFEVLLDWIIMNNTHSTDDKEKVPVAFNNDMWVTHVTIEPDKESCRLLVFLHSMETRSDRTAKNAIGYVPSNSHIDHIIMKNLKYVKSGLLYKIQYEPPNIKVIFPYGLYKFNKDGKIVVDHSVKKDKRFDDLVFGE
jgi:hypothetical protein